MYKKLKKLNSKMQWKFVKSYLFSSNYYRCKKRHLQMKMITTMILQLCIVSFTMACISIPQSRHRAVFVVKNNSSDLPKPTVPQWSLDFLFDWIFNKFTQCLITSLKNFFEMIQLSMILVSMFVKNLVFFGSQILVHFYQPEHNE